MDREEQELQRVAPLAEPARRAIYLYVVSRGEDVTRDEVASALRIGRSLAAFHLEKLLEHGLVEAGYRRVSGRSGPGAGRPAKVYRPGPELRLTVPHRDYELAVRLLAEAAQQGDGAATREDVALEAGRAVVGRRGAKATKPGGQVVRRLREILRQRGYQPYVRKREIRLSNCPFGPVAVDHEEMVCPMNLALVRGILEGLGARTLEAIREERTADCCVVIRSTDAPPQRSA